MPQTLATLIGNCGPDLFREYFDVHIGHPLPPLPPDVPASQFGAVSAAQLSDLLSNNQLQKLRRDLQRASSFKHKRNRDLLEFSLHLKGLKPRFPDGIRSAFQKALFLYLHESDAFQLAEKLLVESRYKFDRRFHDTYRAEFTSALDALRITDSFEKQIGNWLREKFGADTEFGIEIAILQPLFPYSAEREFQILVFWGDDRGGVEIFNRQDGIEIIFPHKLETISICLNPHTKTQTICGKYLQRDGRQVLADIVNAELLGNGEEASKLKNERYDLHPLLNSGFLRVPARGPIQRAGITSLTYNLGPDTHVRTRAIRIGETLRVTLESDYGEVVTPDLAHLIRNELSRASVLSARFRIDCHPNTIFPDGHSITGSITPAGFSIDTKLDVDCYIARLWFEHLRLRMVHAPLFGVAA